MFKHREPWHVSLGKIITRFLRWFVPGIGVKRWFLVLLAGITFIGVGLAILVLDTYRSAPDTWWLPVVSVISL
jgi:hypothetical protein